MKNISPFNKVLIVFLSIVLSASVYLYFRYFHGFYETIVIEDLSKSENYLTKKPSRNMYYNFRWIKIEGELYGETTLSVIGIDTNKLYPKYGIDRDTLAINLKKQGKFDTLIKQDYYSAAQFQFQNIPKSTTKGKLKAKIHVGNFF
jgi:hypothetical protein